MASCDGAKQVLHAEWQFKYKNLVLVARWRECLKAPKDDKSGSGIEQVAYK